MYSPLNKYVDKERKMLGAEKSDEKNNHNVGEMLDEWELSSTMSQFDRGRHQIFQELTEIVSENEEVNNVEVRVHFYRLVISCLRIMYAQLKLQLSLMKHKYDVLRTRVPHCVLKTKTISWNIENFSDGDNFFFTSDKFSFGDFTFSLFLGFHELAYKTNYGFLLVLENGIVDVKHIDLHAKFRLCHPFGAHYTKYRDDPLRFHVGEVAVRGIHTFIDNNWIKSYLFSDGSIHLEVTLSDLKVVTSNEGNGLSMVEVVRSSEISDPYDS